MSRQRSFLLQKKRALPERPLPLRAVLHVSHTTAESLNTPDPPRVMRQRWRSPTPAPRGPSSSRPSAPGRSSTAPDGRRLAALVPADAVRDRPTPQRADVDSSGPMIIRPSVLLLACCSAEVIEAGSAGGGPRCGERNGWVCKTVAKATVVRIHYLPPAHRASDQAQQGQTPSVGLVPRVTADDRRWPWDRARNGHGDHQGASQVLRPPSSTGA